MGHLLPHAQAERIEQRPISDAAFFIRYRGVRPIKGNLRGRGIFRRSARHAQRRGRDCIAVDDQIYRGCMVFFGQASEGEIFQPHAGMKDLRLMSGQKNQALGIARRWADIAISRRPAPRGIEQFPPRLPAKSRQLLSLKVIIRLRLQGKILLDQIGHPIPGRMDHHGPVFPRGVKPSKMFLCFI